MRHARLRAAASRTIPTPVRDADPLTVLLSRTWTAQVIEIDNAVEAAGAERFGRLFRISLASWANGLRLIDEAGTALGEVRHRARADCNIPGLERWGWITVDMPQVAGAARRPGYGSSRGLSEATVLFPTRAGEAAQRLWPRTIGVVEDRWRARFGADLLEELTAALAGLCDGMPWAPPQVNPSDGFFTRLVEGADGREVTRRWLVVLLGQALTALTVQREEGSPVSLPLGENLLPLLEEGALAARELPARSGLSKEAIAMAVGFLVRRGFAVLHPGRVVEMTPAGERVLGEYRSRAAEPVGDDSLRSLLGRVLSQPAALAEGLEPPPGCWRGGPPYLAQTRRLMADPAQALPRHPMVLHRGGWPDGS